MGDAQTIISPYCDHQRRTCIQVDRDDKRVKFISLDVSLGLEVQSLSVEAFDRIYRKMDGYPAAKACQLYLNYSQNIGATKEALSYLGNIINITAQEFTTASTKKTAAANLAEKKTAAKPEKPAKAEKPAKLAKPKTTTVKSPVKKGGDKKLSASQMFQDLIMKGELTDDKIFEEVKEKFGLDDKKRGYVKWYRNHLAKQGANPPDAK